MILRNGGGRTEKALVLSTAFTLAVVNGWQALAAEESPTSTPAGSTTAVSVSGTTTAKAPVAATAAAGVGKVYLADGKAKFLKGQYKDAVASFEKVLKDSPNNAEVHLMLGQSYIKLKTFDKAREQLRLAIRTGAGSASAQKANLALMTLPRHLIAPKSGPHTRLIASMLGLGRSRGGEAKPTVIDFYAPWCQPCKQLDTLISKAKATYGDKVTFMTVNVDDPSSQAIMDQYDVSPIPTMVFLNPEGEVITYAVGYSGDGSVNDGIKKILPKVN